MVERFITTDLEAFLTSAVQAKSIRHAYNESEVPAIGTPAL
jgi:hypothetical protein